MKSFLKSILRILGFIILVVGLLLASLTLIPTSAPGSYINSSYPPPDRFLSPSSTRASSPEAYPPPATTLPPTLSVTPIQILTHQAQLQPSPNWWPTGVPWPPPKMTSIKMPTQTPVVFPTPELTPTPSGKKPDKSYTLLYAFYPDTNTAPHLQSTIIDYNGQQWGSGSIISELRLSVSFPGPFLSGLFISPKENWGIATTTYGEAFQPYLINLSTGKTSRILPDKPTLRFLGWASEDKIILQMEPFNLSVVWEVDISTFIHKQMDFMNLGNGKSHIQEVAISPDGNFLADAWVFPPTQSIRDICILQIGITNLRENKRSTIKEFPASCGISEYSLQWSADGKYISWVVLASHTDGKTTIKSQAQLWINNTIDGETVLASIIGNGVRKISPPKWSPLGLPLAFIKYENSSEKLDSGNIFIYYPSQKLEIKSTAYVNKSISNLSWSPNGEWLTYVDSTVYYGTLFARNPNKDKSIPLAGPSIPNSPFAWIK